MVLTKEELRRRELLIRERYKCLVLIPRTAEVSPECSVGVLRDSDLLQGDLEELSMAGNSKEIPDELYERGYKKV